MYNLQEEVASRARRSSSEVRTREMSPLICVESSGQELKCNFWLLHIEGDSSVIINACIHRTIFSWKLKNVLIQIWRLLSAWMFVFHTPIGKEIKLRIFFRIWVVMGCWFHHFTLYP